MTHTEILSDCPSLRQALEPLLESFDLEGIAKYIQAGKAKRIVCLCGAGISVNAGLSLYLPNIDHCSIYVGAQKHDPSMYQGKAETM